MRLYIAGGCSEHGRNSFLVTGEKVCFLVDAGRMKENPDKPFPELREEEIRSVSYLFLTHSHTDHTGAIGYLADHGFRGTVVGTDATLQHIPPFAMKSQRLEDLTPSLTEYPLTDGLTLTWGRSGHCIGSVWYEFGADGQKILFTGDYEEDSRAYECDHIRGRSVNLAVVDCAYGTEEEDAAVHWQELEEALDRAVGEGKSLLFPVPSHGRGFDVVRLLAERGVPVVLTDSLVEEYRSTGHREFWLKKAFLDACGILETMSILDFRRSYQESLAGGGSFPEGYDGAAILVRDSQLVKEENRQIALGVAARGGRTILTGKQDPASFARTLLDRGDAEFHRISVHQNITEMKRLMGRNSFDRVVPYHCREKLAFSEKGILVASPGDVIEI